jgi:hypothetical protein
MPDSLLLQSKVVARCQLPALTPVLRELRDLFFPLQGKASL